MELVWSVVLLISLLLLEGCAAASLRGDGDSLHERDLESFSLNVDTTTPSSDKNIEIIALSAGLGGGMLLILVVVLFLLILCVCIVKRRSKSRLQQSLLKPNGTSRRYDQPHPQSRAEPGVAETFNRQRREKEQQDKKKATEAMQYFLRNHTQYRKETELSDLGSRMQKHWFRVSSEEESRTKMLLTTTPVSQKCPLTLDSSTLKGMNKLMKELRKHPLLQPVMTVDYLGNLQQIVIVQQFHDRGSLKDTIYRATPTTDWSNKYSRRSRGLSTDKIRLYGRQILEAMMFLYERGFPTLGHVQTGNIFVVNDVCQLGGYENTLLGYKTRLYKTCKEIPLKLDIIMFGHLVFEMCCGYELTQMRPEETDYKVIKKEECQEILRFIFEEDFPHEIQEIQKHEFFAVSLPQLDEFDPNTVKTGNHGSIQSVLEKARKGKPRMQKAPKQKKKDDDATPIPTPVPPAPKETPPTPKEAPPTPADETDATPIAEATPTPGDGQEREAIDSESGMLTGDSAGNQSGDSKEGKRKSRLKFGLGGKKKKRLSSGEGGASGRGGNGDGADDKTPITRTPVGEPA